MQGNFFSYMSLEEKVQLEENKGFFFPHSRLFVLLLPNNFVLTFIKKPFLPLIFVYFQCIQFSNIEKELN